MIFHALQIIIYHDYFLDRVLDRIIAKLILFEKMSLSSFNLPSSVKCAPPIFVLPSEKETIEER